MKEITISKFPERKQFTQIETLEIFFYRHQIQECLPEWCGPDGWFSISGTPALQPEFFNRKCCVRIEIRTIHMLGLCSNI